MRTLLLLLLALPVFGSGVLAQEGGQEPHVYLAHVQPIVPGQSPKPLMAALVDIDPDADLSHDRDTDIMRITTMVEFTFDGVALAAESSGFMLLDLILDTP